MTKDILELERQLGEKIRICRYKCNIIMSASTFLMGTSGSAPHTGAYISGSNGNLSISSSNFFLAPAGDVTMQGSVTATTGEIGGFTIDSDQIAATYVTMSTGGTYGYISLGNPAPTSATQGGDANGAFFSGRGDFCIGDFDGARVQYNGSTNVLILSSSKFYLGSDSQYVSGSNGNIEISSSNFHLSNTGDVTMQGTVTADTITANTAGTIAGFVLTANQLEATGSTSGTGIKMSAAATAEKITVGDFDGDNIELDGANKRLIFNVANTERIRMGRSIGFSSNRDGLQMTGGQIYMTGQSQNAGSAVNAAHFRSFLAIEDDNSTSNHNFFGVRTLGSGGGTDSNTQYMQSAYFAATIGSQGPLTQRPMIGVGGYAVDNREQAAGAGSGSYWIGVEGLVMAGNSPAVAIGTITQPYGGWFNQTVKIQGTNYTGTHTSLDGALILERADTSLSDGDELGTIYFTAPDPSDNVGSIAVHPGVGIGDTTYHYGKIYVEAEAGGSAGLWAGKMFFDLTDEGTISTIMMLDGENKRVGINDTTPSYTLDVTGDIRVTDDMFVNDDLTVTGITLTSNGTDAAPGFQLGSANDGLYHSGGIRLMVNNVNEFLFADGGAFHADADIVAYSTSVASDIRLKTNIQSISSSLDKIKKLRPVEFDWLVDRDAREYGLIAQEVETVVPEIVVEYEAIGDTKEFLQNLDGTDTFKTVDYSKLSILLIDAVKEQQKQIDELKEKLDAVTK